jgi:hypothetical protein
MFEVCSPHAYQLDLLASHLVHIVFHVLLLKHIASNLLPEQHAPPLPPIVVDNEEEYLVEVILDSNMRYCELGFQVE